MKSLVKNAADEGQVKEAKGLEKNSRKRELADLLTVASTIQGKRFIWRYLTQCGVFKTSFTGNNQTFFLEGQRNIGLQLLTDVNEADPQLYVDIMKANKEGD